MASGPDTFPPDCKQRSDSNRETPRPAPKPMPLKLALDFAPEQRSPTSAAVLRDLCGLRFPPVKLMHLPEPLLKPPQRPQHVIAPIRVPIKMMSLARIHH